MLNFAIRPCGEVAEWSNAPDSKSGIRLYRIEGSNPSLSAKTKTRASGFLFWWEGSDLPAQVAIGIRKARPASPAGVEEPSQQARRGNRTPLSAMQAFFKVSILQFKPSSY